MAIAMRTIVDCFAFRQVDWHAILAISGLLKGRIIKV